MVPIPLYHPKAKHTKNRQTETDREIDIEKCTEKSVKGERQRAEVPLVSHRFRTVHEPCFPASNYRKRVKGRGLLYSPAAANASAAVQRPLSIGLTARVVLEEEVVVGAGGGGGTVLTLAVSAFVKGNRSLCEGSEEKARKNR